jgi:hypothetical protein
MTESRSLGFAWAITSKTAVKTITLSSSQEWEPALAATRASSTYAICVPVTTGYETHNAPSKTISIISPFFAF